jgi:hypothetical protein
VTINDFDQAHGILEEQIVPAGLRISEDKICVSPPIAYPARTASRH